MSASSTFTGRSQFTALKQDHLGNILNTHAIIFNAIQKRNPGWYDKEYFYADICAGDGGDDMAGSPAIFTNVQKKHHLNCKPYFIDHNPLSIGSSKRRVKNEDAIWICEDHALALPGIIPTKNKLGLLYFDPNGDPFNKYPYLLADFYDHKTTQKIDCLLYFSGTSIKRILKAPNASRTWTISEDMERIGKDVWLIREPFGKHQWSFLLGVNWADFPEFKKIGFHKTTSTQGQSILNKINYTAKELKEKNIKLYNQPQQMDMFSGFEGGRDVRA